MARIRNIYFRSGVGEMALTLARPVRRRPRPSREQADSRVRAQPVPTHHAPCSVGKVEELAARLARKEELWSQQDFIPTDPIMIERYVFNGRRASAYKVAELLASSPRNRHV